MIQFIRPSAGSFIHSFSSATGSEPAILLQGYATDVKKIGLRPLQIGPSDKFGNKPCYHLNLKGEITLLDPSQFDTIKEEYHYLDEACTIPNYRTLFKPTGKTWRFDQLVLQGKEYHSTTVPLYFKYYAGWGYYATVRLTQTTNIVWIDRYHYRYECWYDTYDYMTQAYGGHVFVWYCEYDRYQTRCRFKQETIEYQTMKHPKIVKWKKITTKWVSYLSARYAVTASSPDKIPSLASFLQRLTTFRQDAMSKESYFFGQCTVRSAQALRVVKTNVFTYLIEAAWLTGPISSLRKVVKDIISSPSSKAASSLFLMYQYGIKMTVLDTMELIKKPRSSVGFDLESFTTSRSQMSDESISYVFGQPISVHHKYYQKLYCRRHSSEFIAAWAALMSVGAYPFLNTVWDAIPFSFVIDWFTRFDDVLETIDSNTILHSYAILSSISTRKSSATFPISVIFPELEGIALGDITVIDYHRAVDKVPPPIWLDLTPQSFTHWVEGAALIVQRM